MPHIGISLEDPRNTLVCEELARRLTADDFQAAILQWKVRLARSPNPQMAQRLASLKSTEFACSIAPASEDPKCVSVWSLSTRPDIVDALWEIGRKLPADSCWVAFRRAVLAHPATGVIFGLAIGSFGYAIRIPDLIETDWPGEIRYRGPDGVEVFSLARYGSDWRFVRPDGTAFAVARAAFDHFGEPVP